MSPRPIDLRHARVRLQALVDTYPELQDPKAQDRLTAWLAQEQRTMTGRKGKPKGDEKARARVQRLRERRKQAGWQPYELWLPPDTAARLSELKQPGEALHDTVGRALQALQSQDAQGGQAVTSNVTSSVAGNTLSYDERKLALLARMRAMQSEGLTLQAIADQLNQEGMPTLSHKGTWKKGTVYNLLKEAP
jgi:hypothetical protein